MQPSQNRRSKLLGAGLWAVLLGYAFVLVKIILLKYGWGAGLRSLNLVPFHFVADLVHPTTSFGVGLKNVLGNFAIFIPLGVLAPALWKRIDRFWKVAVLGLCVSALFELLQAVLGLGATDVDDLILNTLGAAAGGALYFFVFARLRTGWQARAAALAFLCAFGLAGVLALWLYAPGELPRVVAYENVEVLGGLDREGYATSRVLEGMDERGVQCRAPQPWEKIAVADIDWAYPLAADAKFYQESITYQFSPNGNVQKTFCTYAAIDRKAARALIERPDGAFADLWLDADGVCTAVMITIYSD